MTLQPPPGYGAGSQDGTAGPGNIPMPPTPAPLDPRSPEATPRPAGSPDAQLGNPDGAWLRVISRAASPIHLDAGAAAQAAVNGGQGVGPSEVAPASLGGRWSDSPDPETVGAAPVLTGAPHASPASTPPAPMSAAGAQVGVDPQRPPVIPARRRPTSPPLGTTVVGGRTVKLHRVAALDRLASGVGYLTVEWLVRQRGFDLLALQDGSVVAPRGNTLTIDLTQPMNRVLIATGTQGTMPLAPSELRVSNGSTQVVVPIDGGTSLGVWPRLTLTRVDEFVVVRHERDPLSGMLDAVANAYGYDERSFVITHTHLLG